MKITNKQIILKGNHNTFQHRLKFKALGGRWNRAEKEWRLPYCIDAIEELSEIGFEIPLVIAKDAYDKILPNQTTISLYKHQEQSFKKACSCPTFADFSDPGTGKTRVQIALMIQRKAFPVLVIAPKSTLKDVWFQQIDELTKLKVIILDKGSIVNKKLLEQDADVFVTNYEMVPLILKELIAKKFEFIIADESTKIKNPRSKRGKACVKLADMVKYKSILTGTPAPNDYMDIFNQIRFLDSFVFGSSWFVFRQRFFHQVPWDKFNWYINDNTPAIIKQRIASFTVQHKKNECLDLPPIVEEVRRIDMDVEQKRIYNLIKTELMAEIEGQHLITPFAITKMMKLRQIASGFVYMQDGTLKISKSKITGLLELIEQIPDKVIVFTHFIESRKVVKQQLQKAGYKVVAFKDDLNALSQFEADPETKILVANIASAAHGLNLQHCSNIIYFELDFSLENFLQSKDRINRIGQKNKMTVFYLLMSKTIEEWILKKLNDKVDINKSLDVSELIDGLKGGD